MPTIAHRHVNNCWLPGSWAERGSRNAAAAASARPASDVPEAPQLLTRRLPDGAFGPAVAILSSLVLDARLHVAMASLAVSNLDALPRGAGSDGAFLDGMQERCAPPLALLAELAALALRLQLHFTHGYAPTSLQSQHLKPQPRASEVGGGAASEFWTPALQLCAAAVGASGSAAAAAAPAEQTSAAAGLLVHLLGARGGSIFSSNRGVFKRCMRQGPLRGWVGKLGCSGRGRTSCRLRCPT